MVTKLHEGELIELLKKKSSYSYEQIADGISISSRQLSTYRNCQNLNDEVRGKIAQFFNIDVRAFTDKEVRELVLKRYVSPNVRSTVGEKEIPARVEKIERKVDSIADDMDFLKSQFERLFKQLNKKG